MATGKIKWFDVQKGFGFIAPEGGGKDIFVHHSVVEADEAGVLRDGEVVEYDAETGPKGMKATRVKRAGAAAKV